MKGKINKDGIIEIQRAGNMKQQCCPYQQEGKAVLAPRCGDWCPMFEEPKGTVPGSATVFLCGTHIEFDDFTDERNQ